MNSPYIHEYRDWSADLFGVKDLVTCKICFFAGKAKAVSRYARHFSVPVGLRIICPTCASIECQAAAIIG